ncbi:MAG: ATP-binding protein [Opitutaceae bacterium]
MTSVQKTTNAPTAGKGDPYWYEWTIGLLQIVEMLDPDSPIASVSLQLAGVKGWDDVVVRRKDGTVQMFQVKHSRVDDSLTFGDLVEQDSDGKSLLGELAKAWHETAAPAGSTCILYTNRTAGERNSSTKAGVSRPPLLKFFEWLKAEIAAGKTCDQCEPTKAWLGAWKEWLAALAPLPADARQTFLTAFAIRTNQADLEPSVDRLRAKLATLFQVSEAKADTLLPALDRALRRWTTRQDTVKLEDLLEALALDDETETERHSPPPPTPFFPSRMNDLAALEKILVEPGPSVFFLSAPPGAGKTSLISELNNRRSAALFGGVIGLRYFAFRPISPETPLIPPDSDQKVRADRLWFDLLTQLRRGLPGKLAAYQVPVRNSLLTWQEARSHVLRIADRLGRETGRPFVIAVDGIDHAARAARYDQPSAAEFFQSLPSPDALAGLAVRLLVAGQPSENYSEYPGWLAKPSSAVTPLTVGQLTEADVLVLLEKNPPPFMPEQATAAARLIVDVTKGNTLSVVFAAAEARHCATVDELVTRLSDQQIGAQLDDYYRKIWSHALAHAAPDGAQLESSLAGALCLAHERITGTFLASCFAGLSRTAEQWELVLARLGPLIIAESGGYRVMHNDVRTFLHGLLAAKSPAERRLVASGMADHYRKPTSNRAIAHAVLHRLLRDGDREQEWAGIFTVDFVFEAAAVGADFDTVAEGAAAAAVQAVRRQDWGILQEVGCAMESLGRWEDKLEVGRTAPTRAKPTAPLFLLSELRVLPREEWNDHSLTTVLNDASRLLAAGEHDRALGMVKRWFGGLTLAEVAKAMIGTDQLAGSIESHGEQLGRVCGRTGFILVSAKMESEEAHHFAAGYEQGWIGTCTVKSTDIGFDEYLRGLDLFYISGWEQAGRQLAEAGADQALKTLLTEIAGNYAKLSLNFRIKAALWALRLGLAADPWTKVLDETGLISAGSESSIHPAVSLARALGWRDAISEIGTLIERVAGRFAITSLDRSGRHTRTLIAAAACMGRIEGLCHRKGPEVARDLVPVMQLQRILASLWHPNVWDDVHFMHRPEAGELCSLCVATVHPLGSDHRAALLGATAEASSRFIIDQRLSSLWDLLRREGNVAHQRAWLEEWIGEKGRLWAEPGDGAEDIYESLEPLAEELGETALLERAAARLSWMQITYRGHKDYSFGMASDWFDQLAAKAPEEWRKIGVRLWSLSDAASAAGCDNRASSEIDSTLGSCAFRSGPDDVRRLIHADQPNERDSTWFYSTRNRLFAGMRGWLQSQTLPLTDCLSAWSLLVGYSEWFTENDATEIEKLREVMLATAGPAKAKLEKALHALTPAEAVRVVPKTDRDRSDGRNDEPLDLVEVRQKFTSGRELKPKEATLLVDDIRKNSTGESIAAVLRGVGTGSEMSSAWSGYDWKTRASLLHLGATCSEAELWALAEAATKFAGAGSRWSESVAQNILFVALARADARGAGELKAGLTRILDMHERWLRGGELALPFKAVTLPAAGPALGWNELAAQELLFLLNSRSAEVLSGALYGIQVLVAHDPKVMDRFFTPLPADEWVLKWLLLATEVWALLHPGEFSRIQPQVTACLKHASLKIRTQAWVILAGYAMATGAAFPSFPQKAPPKSSDEDPNLVLPARELFHTADRKFGGMRLVDRELSVKGIIKRIEATTGADLDSVVAEVAEVFRKMPAETKDDRIGSRQLCRDGDMYCGTVQADEVLAKALEGFMAGNPLPEKIAPRFAQGYLSGDDPWILSRTPMPDPNPNAWPGEKVLGYNNQTAPEASVIRQKMFDLAMTHGVRDTECVLAAHFELASSHEDLDFWLWWEEGRSDDLTRRSSLVTTVSARVFPWLLGRWWEPEVPRGKRPLAFRTGAMLRLGHAMVDLYPAWLWKNELKWEPDPSDPFVWKKAGKMVAHYERLHGPHRRVHGNGRQRQPILNRWIVTKVAWAEAQRVLGALRVNDSFERHEMKHGA